MSDTKKYSDKEATRLVEEALYLNSQTPIYSPKVVDGEIKYIACIPGVHWLKDKKTKEELRVLAADDAVVVAENSKGIATIIYVQSLGDYTVVMRAQSVSSLPATIDADSIPPIGSVYTHKSGRPYLIFGVLNTRRNAENRAAGRYEEIVCYVGPNGATWGKTLSNFNETMIPGGNFKFNEGTQMEYMGICDNGTLADGFMTENIKALMEALFRNGITIDPE